MTPAELQAHQTLLAGLHAAIYAYQVIAGQNSGSTRSRALARVAQHEQRSAAIQRTLTIAKQKPVAAKPGYVLTEVPNSATAAAKLAATLETQLAAAAADVVGATNPKNRINPANWQLEYHQQAQAWGGELSTFPGLPERPS